MSGGFSASFGVAFYKPAVRKWPFSYQAPLLWNQLPVHVQEADFLSTLRFDFLLEKAYSRVLF